MDPSTNQPVHIMSLARQALTQVLCSVFHPFEGKRNLVLVRHVDLYYILFNMLHTKKNNFTRNEV